MTNPILTDGDTLKAVHAAGKQMQGQIQLTYLQGPDDIETPTVVACALARAVEAAVMAKIEQQTVISAAMRDVMAERQRHQTEGWSPEHDDEHAEGELALAAAAYVLQDFGVPVLVRGEVKSLPGTLWPWEPYGWNPKDRRRNLVRAASLLIAEMDRIDRAAPGATA